MAIVCVLPAVVAAQIPPPDAAALQRSAASFEMLPGVVVDPDGDAVYLMTREGAVEAVSLSAGNRLWLSEAAAKPLALYGDLLVAQAEGGGAELEIALLDARRDGRRLDALRTALPAGVAARIDDSAGQSFAVDAQVVAATLQLSWTAQERYTGGLVPNDGRPLVQEQSQGYRLDVGASSLVEVAAPPLARPVLPASVQAWSDQATATLPVQRLGELFVATEVEGPGRRIVLKRWDASTGGPLGDIELLAGEHVLQLPSTDGRHLLICERVEPGAFDEYEWTIYALETGQRIGQLRHHQSHAPFVVSGSTVLFEARPYGLRDAAGVWRSEPRKLHAVVLGSGATVWERPLRDTAFRGELPP